ncbi:hypothetical protein [Aeromonas caviae]|uniref:Uncharacterized protein n=1 Tax=Aeromonas caviae TaxID=648 RepID=A0AAJ6CRY4_AERCA|nr:hypothetical protein [Aeromonas caviae]WFF99922.1 hypothetical protein P5S46_10265 [Aeromonas caviae]
MERQTLQQQPPIYHVCQQCGGEGCEACSDLCILDGDIDLDPDWSDELPTVTPINGVIGISRETIPQRVARYNSGRNRLLAIKMQRASSLNPNLYCPRCFLSNPSGESTCFRASCRSNGK